MRTRAAGLFRVFSLVAPSWIAWYVAFSAHRTTELAETLARAMGPVYIVLAALLAFRLFTAVRDYRRDPSSPILARIDVLTARGSALAWLSTLAFVLAVTVGYASLAVVGMLGTGVLHVAAITALVALRAVDPIRCRTITRTFTPAVAAEGDKVVEEIRCDGTRIPLGFRLFLMGRIGPRWATSRHAVGAEAGEGEVLLESNVGPAVRGEHTPEPLGVWLEDVLGLCRSPTFPIDGGKVTVTPAARPVADIAPLRAHGIGPRAARSARQLPTEGYFDLREYKEGDDVRRIHWVRSLAANELVVRLPDELPPDRPRIRLVLDTFFPESLAMDCDAPGEVLDALVGVWLAVGKALIAAGARVTLVTAVPGTRSPVRQVLTDRGGSEALRLGARVAWQSAMPVDALLTDEPTFVIARGTFGPAPASPHVRWVVVIPEVAKPVFGATSGARYPYPFGSSENRWLHRRAVEEEHAKSRTDHARAMLALGTVATRPPPGSFAAYPTASGVFHLEALQ